MEFRKITSGIQFYYSADRTLNVPTGYIESIITKKDISGSPILLIYTGLDDPTKVRHADVTAPITEDVDELRDVLLLWNSDILQKGEFVAIAGQTVFTTTFVLQTNVNFYINGVLQPSTSYTYTAGTHTLTWTGAAFVGAEEIVIETY